MAGFSNEFFRALLNGDGIDVAALMSLHDTEPNGAGSSELSGGGYAQQPVTWATPSGDSVDTAAPVIFNVPAVPLITHAGLWTSSGTWLGWLKLAVDQPFPTPGTLTIELATVQLQSRA